MHTDAQIDAQMANGDAILSNYFTVSSDYTLVMVLHSQPSWESNEEHEGGEGLEKEENRKAANEEFNPVS